MSDKIFPRLRSGPDFGPWRKTPNKSEGFFTVARSRP
jgi:hypothetical protein